MVRNYFKIAFRNIQKNKSYSFLNIFGFAVGIAAYIMISLYVNYELSYDKHHKNADRIYQIFSSFAATTPAPMAPTLKEEFPEVEAAARVMDSNGFLVRYEDKVFTEDNWVWADRYIFDVFTFPLVKGDRNTALNNPFSIIITEETALKYFGSENPVNKVLNCTFNGKSKDYIVTGVLKNIPENSYIKGDFFAQFETLKELGRPIDRWNNYSTDSFVLLKEGTDEKDFEKKYNAMLKKKLNIKNNLSFYNKRLTDMHLRSKGVRHLFSQVSDVKYIYLFSMIAVVILLMACINYLNLAAARSVQRGKEVAVRKVAGAYRFQIIRQFLGESLLLTAISMSLALVIVFFLLPFFNSLVQSEGTIGLFNDIKFLLLLITSVLFVGLLSGIYPAFFVSSFKPAVTLKGSSLSNSGGLILRNILVVIQFSISIILLISTIVTSNQVKFLRSKKLGFKKDQIITVTVQDIAVFTKQQAVKEELMKYPEILKTTFSTAVPIEINWLNNYNYIDPENPDNKVIDSHYARVDYDYLDLFEMKIVKGRKFIRELDEGKNVYIINEAICKQLGWDNPIGKKYGERGTWGKVVGVVNDFHYRNLQSSIGPVTLCLSPGQGYLMSIKVNTNDIQKTLSSIENVWNTFSSGYPFEYYFLDDKYDAMYKTEIRREKSFGSFSFVAVLICCLGLFGLVSFTVEQSKKEIGIRKVLGASTPVLIRMLLWKFLKWTAAANIIAFPAAYYFMNSWLQEYAYRISLGWGTFLSAGLIAASIAFLTVISVTIKATRANPVDSLRYE